MSKQAIRTVKFQELLLGVQFTFNAERDFTSMARGPWRKIGPRKYERVSDGMVCRVGSVNARCDVEVTR